MYIIRAILANDFDLFVTCEDKDSRALKMEKLNSDLNDNIIIQDQNRTNTCSPEEQRLAVDRCVQSLVHASKCCDANCQWPKCQLVKSVAEHTKRCKLRITENCYICTQFVALCFWHAKSCFLREGKCTVQLCAMVKRRIKQQELKPKRLQKAQLLRR